MRTSEEKIEMLLDEYASVRSELRAMIVELESISNSISSIFPAKFDIRYKRVFEEKIHIVTELFQTLLSLRQEIAKSLKTEIELREKITGKDIEEDLNSLDIRSILKLVESNMSNEEDKTIKGDQ